jgi:carboxyl-terminal processing protease
LHDDIAALDAMRNQKTVSLNLKTREAERKRLDDERLQRENAWRAAHGVNPVKSLEEIKDDAAAGILLDETTQIAADMAVATTHRAGPTTTARRTDLH